MTTSVLTRPPTAAEPAPIPFPRLLRAEWRKATGARAARWLLAATALITVAALAVPLLFARQVAQTRAAYLTWAGLGLSRLLPIVLLLAMTAEWSQRTAMTTFALEPRRGRVLRAKVLAGLILSALGGCFAFLAAEMGVAAARAAGHHVAVGWNWPELAGFAAFVVLTGAIGMAVGAAVHNTAAAIVTYFALGAAFSLLGVIPAAQRAGDWVDTYQTFGWMLSGQWSGREVQIATSAAIWIAVPLAIGWVRTIRREAR
jgi:ABC-2 type transport system permease protein